MPVSIFVSYSHQDVGLVQPVVRLLRATEDFVFQDLDSIKPGRKWRREIEEALYAAQLVILFWCYHSSRSTEVRKEYELALTTRKDVLPVLLDNTPLPEQLNEFQWVDFRQLVGVGHRSYILWVKHLAVVLLVWVLVSELSMKYCTFGPAPEPSPEQFPTFAIILLVVAVGVLVTWIVRKARLRRARAAPTAYHQHMAEEIQAELFRRGIGLA